MQNISDPNTEWKTKRKVTLDLSFSTKEDREIIECDVIAKVKIAPKLGVHTKFLLDKNLKGEVLASEFRKQVPGQQAMKVDPETGEILQEESIENKKEDLSGLQIVK